MSTWTRPTSRPRTRTPSPTTHKLPDAPASSYFPFPLITEIQRFPNRQTAQRKHKPPKLENKGSLITYEDNGQNRCVGAPWYAEGHGCYDPTHGRVDVAKEEAEIHNRELDNAMLAGLDEQCHVGKGAMFYPHPKAGESSNIKVTTFNGTLVAIAHRYGKVMLAFTRHRRGFSGRIRNDADCVWFKRIS